MKKQLIYTALLATAAVLLPACDEGEKKAETTTTEATQQQPQAPVQPTEEEIQAAVAEQLPDCPFAAPASLVCELPQKNADGSLNITATLVMKLTENMYARESAPAAFNKEREGVNAAANAAMQPESLYLLQVGATTDMITDADRAARPLPENLLAPINELKELADSSVYTVSSPAGTEINVPATMRATYADGAWKFEDVNADTAALVEMADLSPESKLQAENAPILTPEFEEARKAEIAEKVAAFNALAEPYIKSREEAARATLTQNLAAAEEAAARAAEQDAAVEAARQEWVRVCQANFAAGKLFSGEWRRGEKFGAVSLRIDDAKTFDDSIQFFGVLYDTKLKEASILMEGRCELAAGEDGAKVNITLYDGQYDPDQPTAEVYDADDGMMVLTLTKDGRLTGSMGCASWSAKPEKAFTVKFAPASADAAKSGNKRR